LHTQFLLYHRRLKGRNEREVYKSDDNIKIHIKEGGVIGLD